jgi:aminopeptidase N
MRTETAPTIQRTDYRPYPYAITDVHLEFDLDAKRTRVCTQMQVESKSAELAPLVLNGEELELESIFINDRQLKPQDYRVDGQTLTLFPDVNRFSLRIVNHCQPDKNTSLMGLYVSGDKLFTQCEAEGFRRITWFADRPDVMARYRVTLRGAKQAYPLLLSNGNLISESDLPDGRHQAVWEDPHPKPCYLFALVAGDFECREKTLKTRSGRQVLLQVYSDRGGYDKTAWALDCLERSLRWDEQRFGLELDLDRFMIVAARDFNMGAMENKGLNIFNSAYVLADPDTATDTVYRAIEAVIGHEYFHNWTGNRVTCRDWFQLSLKEGLTVFRDQEFSADMLAQGQTGPEALSARAVKRIDDVSTLRLAQFPEDAGPMAHPIRPESYQEIGNFYTATVYEKGAEVIRMQHTLLGEQGFRQGMDEYFRRHDGQAVTCDDFVAAMESIYSSQHPGNDLNIFRRWYQQAGTPHVRVALDYNVQQRQCTLTLEQHNPPVGVEKLQNPPLPKGPLHIPLAIGVLSPDGQPMHVSLDGEVSDAFMLELTQTRQSWTLHDVSQKPVLSLPRNFSAPVVIEHERDNAELGLLASHDTDPFARWEAIQELAYRQMLQLVDQFARNDEPTVEPVLLHTLEQIATDTSLTPAYKARALSLPTERELLQKTSPHDPVNAVKASRFIREHAGRTLAKVWNELYTQACQQTRADYTPDAASAGWRALKNLALAYTVHSKADASAAMASSQYYQAQNMTDRMGGLSALMNTSDSDAITQALDHFYQQWQNDALVMDKWFALQATARFSSVETIRALMLHPAFSLRNPNRARALVFQFCMNNLQGIHTPEGYSFWAEQVLALDAINPEIAARLARAFDNWARFSPTQAHGMKQALERINAHEKLSRNVNEIISKALTL